MPTILIMSASPLDQDRLRLGAEVKEIRNALRRSRNRENWRIESNEASTVDDLRRALLDVQPTVVHFCGHGDGEGGLCFEDPDGYTQPADAAPLARLFHHFKKDLKCVVLNACFSETQAEIIRKEIDYVVGMRASIEDESARRFAVAFYDAVLAGTDFRTAFDLACTALDLNKLTDSDAPVFLTSPHLERITLVYNPQIPEIERFVNAYMNTPFSERAPFTTTGDALTPLLTLHYGEQILWNIESVRLLSLQPMHGDNWKAAIQVVTGDGKRTIIYYLQIRDRSILLEWEATVGLWSTPPKTYLALGSSEEIIARVKAVLADYYNHNFRDKKQSFQSIRLRTTDNVRLYGYVRRNTPVYAELMTIMSDGKEHSLTLGIVNATDQTEEAVIERVLSKTWLYSPNENGT